MKLFILIFCLIICGCSTPMATIMENPTEKNCKSCIPMWTGTKGASPADNCVYKCYDWVIQSKELYNE